MHRLLRTGLLAMSVLIANHSRAVEPGTPVYIDARFLEIAPEPRAKAQVSAALGLSPPSAGPAMRVLAKEAAAEATRKLLATAAVECAAAPLRTTPAGTAANLENRHDFSYATAWRKVGTTWEASDHDTQKTGVTLAVTPVLQGDKGTLTLLVKAKVLRFLGYHDVDSGAKTPASANDLPPAGRRAHPVFAPRQVETSVELFDGQTFVLELNGAGLDEFPPTAPGRCTVLLVSATTAPPTAEQIAARTILPKVEFREAGLGPAAEFFTHRLHQLAPGMRAVMIKAAPDAEIKIINLSLTNISVLDAVRYAAATAGVGFSATRDELIMGGKPTPFAGEKVSRATSLALTRAQQVDIPSLEFRDTSFEQALDFLRVKSSHGDATRRGVNFVVAGTPDTSQVRISFRLINTTLANAIEAVAKQANMRVCAEANALILEPVPASRP